MLRPDTPKGDPGTCAGVSPSSKPPHVLAATRMFLWENCLSFVFLLLWWCSVEFSVPGAEPLPDTLSRL